MQVTSVVASINVVFSGFVTVNRPNFVFGLGRSGDRCNVLKT